MKSVGGDRCEVHSAGARASIVHPLAIRVMAEAGIDISRQRSKSVDEFGGQVFDWVITVCGDESGDVCPVFAGSARERLQWNFRDPARAHGTEAEALRAFRDVRDDIRASIEAFVSQLNSEPCREEPGATRKEGRPP